MDRFHALTAGFQAKYDMDYRFLQLTIFMCLLVWPWLVVMTVGFVHFVWTFVLLCQVIALPFSVLGWAAGFRLGRRMGLQPRWSAMVAGCSALIAAELGLAFILRAYFVDGAQIVGHLALPSLVVQVTVGVLWLYRADTGPKALEQAKRTAA